MGLVTHGSARMGRDMTTSTNDSELSRHDGAAAKDTTGDHGGDGAHDDLGHDTGDFLGPVDVIAWGAGVFGIVLGLAVGLAFALATGAL